VPSRANGRGVGIARYIRHAEGPQAAEIAVTIVDEWQGRGLGTELLTRLTGRARQEGIHRFTALVADDNIAMAGLLRSMSATHADDIGVPMTHDEQAGRTAWRARYSRFALAEAKPQLEIRHAGARTAITDGSTTAELDDDELIEAVMGRLGQTSGFSATLRVFLSMMP
jgi:GNAT superfamily N-acetyltransferase